MSVQCVWKWIVDDGVGKEERWRLAHDKKF